MTLNELKPGRNQSNQVLPFNKSGGQSFQKPVNGSGHSAFANILGSRMETQAKPRYTTFKETYKNNTEVSANKPNISGKAETTEKIYKQTGKSREKSESNKKPELNNAENSLADSILYAFASVLGVDMSDLQKIMKAAGINAEAVNDLNDGDESISKISQLLGLNDEQKGTLTEFLGILTETEGSRITAERINESGKSVQQASVIAESMGSGEISNTFETSSAGQATEPGKASESGKPVVLDQSNSTVHSVVGRSAAGGKTAAEALEAYINELGENIKARLSELKNSIGTERQAKLSELKKMTDSFRQKNVTVVNEAADNRSVEAEAYKSDTDKPDTVGLLTPVKAEEAISQEEKSVAKKAEKELTADSKFSELKTSEGKASESKTSDIKTPENSNFTPQNLISEKQSQIREPLSVMQPEIIKAADVIEKNVLETPAAPREIISQVIEKAKVILTPDKSEMLMDLKPESLGRISLKVASENGIVMAKFVADSQQVKQIIEANMQLLKDSLEKQGFNVQGFSVSVRQDLNRQANYGSQTGNGRSRSISGTANRSEGIAAGIPGIASAISGADRLRWGGSTINLTA